VLLRAIRSAQPSNDLLRPGGVVAILGFVAVTVGVSLAVAFILKASGIRTPRPLVSRSPP
jgi:hypothetical protein